MSVDKEAILKKIWDFESDRGRFSLAEAVIFPAMTEYSQLISGSKDAELEGIKEIARARGEAINELQSLLESKTKECEELKKDLTSYKESFETNKEQFMELAAHAKDLEIDLEYWKARCEAAEEHITALCNHPRGKIRTDAWKKWQQLKQQNQ